MKLLRFALQKNILTLKAGLPDQNFGYMFYYSFTAILYIIGFKFNSDFIIGLGLLFYFIIGLIPFISVTTRRLHDINKTGFAQFIVLIPFLGILILIIWCVTEGEKKKNFYGPPIKFKKW